MTIRRKVIAGGTGARGLPVSLETARCFIGSRSDCTDLPVGRRSDFPVESRLQKYFCFRTPQITSTTPAIPSHQEERFAIVTDVGCGMRWTRQRLARDGIAGRVVSL